MMHIKSISFLVLLCPLVSAAGTCHESGNCLVDDETSLVQVKSVLKPGSEREEDLEEVAQSDKDDSHEEDEELLSLEHETQEHDKTKGIFDRRRGTTGGGPFGIFSAPKSSVSAPAFVVPAGCNARTALCIGSAPWCGGQKEHCTTRSKTVVGWTKRCSGASMATRCLSGWKVRCATCPSTVQHVPYPTPTSIVAQWTAPVFDRRRAAPPQVIAPVTVPPFGMASYSYSYNASMLSKSKAAMKAAMANIATFKATVCNITNQIQGISKNITYFTQKEARAKQFAFKSRQAAVRFAKKRTLANITVMKAKNALDDAYMSQYGAANRAIRVSAQSSNARRQRVYYQKLLIDKGESLKRANAALRVGKIAVQKANSNTLTAKKMQKRNARILSSGRGKKKYVQQQNVKTAQNLAMKQAMENAYAMASPLFGTNRDMTRNATNVPVWGRGFGSVTFSASAPPCRCVGFASCSCGK